MNLRNAQLDDLDNIIKVERTCFPIAEAATPSSFKNRLEHYPDHFWLLESDNELIGFVDGMVTDQEHLTDEMYEKAELHNEKGNWQMIFGVNVLPEYRKKGYAATILQKVISDAKAQGRKGIVLTCKDKLVHYYAKFGFIDEGISDSEHGNVVWHEMRLSF